MHVDIAPNPAEIGSTVIMTCSWNSNSHDKVVKWIHQRANQTQQNNILTFSILDGVVTTQSHQPDKVEGLIRSNYSRGHQISIKLVTEEDRGRYWCTVTIAMETILSNNRPQLILQGNFVIRFQNAT